MSGGPQQRQPLLAACRFLDEACRCPDEACRAACAMLACRREQEPCVMRDKTRRSWRGLIQHSDSPVRPCVAASAAQVQVSTVVFAAGTVPLRCTTIRTNTALLCRGVCVDGHRLYALGRSCVIIRSGHDGDRVTGGGARGESAHGRRFRFRFRRPTRVHWHLGVGRRALISLVWLQWTRPTCVL